MEISETQVENRHVFDRLTGPKPIVDIVPITWPGRTVPYKVDHSIISEDGDPENGQLINGYGSFENSIKFPDEDDKKSMFRGLSKNELINALVNGVFMSNGKNSQGVNETHYMQWPEIVWIEPNFKKFGDSAYLIEVERPVDPNDVYYGNTHNILITKKTVPATDTLNIYEVRAGIQYKDGKFGKFGYRNITREFKEILDGRLE